MTDSVAPELRPAFAHYYEWIGYHQYVPPEAIANAKASIESSGGNWEEAVATLMYFKDARDGIVYVVCAPLKSNSDRYKRRMI